MILGSLTIENNGRITIIGILSSGTSPDCITFVTGFTRVSYQLQWIRENSDVSVTGCSQPHRRPRI